MNSYAILLTGLVIVGATGFVSQPHRNMAKCPNAPILFPDAPETVHVLNGKLTEADVLKRLNKESVEVIEIVCATDLHRVFGIQSRRGGVSIFTAPGPHSLLKKSLESLVNAQNAYSKQHGHFAKSLSDLSWNDPSGLITVKLEVSENGARWSATGTHRHLLAPSSSVVVSGTAQE
jgi:hypothetical protein